MVQDFPRWQLLSNDCFTVRSGYKLRAGVSFGPVERCWSVIARYKGLPRVRTFLWLAYLGKLMTNDALDVFFGLSIKEWFVVNLTQAWKFVRDYADWDLLFGSLIWLLWLRRNSRIFESEDVRWESILAQGRRMQQVNIHANQLVGRENFQSVRAPRSGVHWQRPPEGWHKLNTDGAVCVDSGMASCGGVLCTDAGGWVIGFSKRLGICTVLEAELWGVFEGLLSAWSVGVPRLILEGAAVITLGLCRVV
ncbi:hypothetical protein V6N12_014341 [Hibiscus sabdariffa]|uniref:RNase H type-1 domain-containing protein n=1 Tax=Hibiscus sabdariffa TaxID=183260 RepID=A0ABR2DMR5_9ROSI